MTVAGTESVCGGDFHVGGSTLAVHNGYIGGRSMNADFWVGFFAGWLALISICTLCYLCYQSGFDAAKEEI